MDERRGQSVYVSFARDYREWFIIKQAHANKTYFHASFHVHHTCMKTSLYHIWKQLLNNEEKSNFYKEIQISFSKKKHPDRQFILE